MRTGQYHDCCISSVYYSTVHLPRQRLFSLLSLFSLSFRVFVNAFSMDDDDDSGIPLCPVEDMMDEKEAQEGSEKRAITYEVWTASPVPVYSSDLGRVRLGSSGVGGLFRFRMTRSIRLSYIQMSHPSSSISSEKLRMSSDELDTRPRPQEDVKVL